MAFAAPMTLSFPESKMEEKPDATGIFLTKVSEILSISSTVTIQSLMLLEILRLSSRPSNALLMLQSTRMEFSLVSGVFCLERKRK
jgi:hypothetical protein